MDQFFSYGLIDGHHRQESLLRDIFSLRYQVYVEEWAYENAEKHPGCLEFDEYDEHSIHYYVCHEPEGNVIGTARIILNSELGLPICKYFDINIKDEFGLSNQKIAEISRLAVSKKFRRRAIDTAIFARGDYSPSRIPRYIDMGRDPRRHCEHELIRGLYISLYKDSKLRGLTHWYAVMAKGLYIILKRWGIVFDQIGPAKNYHGLRAPYLVSIKEVETSLQKINPELLKDAKKLKFH